MPLSVSIYVCRYFSNSTAIHNVLYFFKHTFINRRCFLTNTFFPCVTIKNQKIVFVGTGKSNIFYFSLSMPYQLYCMFYGAYPQFLQVTSDFDAMREVNGVPDQGKCVVEMVSKANCKGKYFSCCMVS